MISLNTNITDLIILNSLNSSTNGIGSTIERLTTGYKLNHAKDNAANLNIVTNLSTKISSLLKIKANTEDGISLLSTAQGALENVQDLLGRLRALSTQAMNGTYGERSLEAMQAEADEIIEQIKQIRNSTEFNGLKLFEGSLKTEETETTTFSAVNRLSSSAKVSRAAAAPRASVIMNENEGAVDFAAGETKTLVISGVSYEITNRNTTASSLSYVRNSSTGQITFISSTFTIKGQADVKHNILIRGTSNIVYGGDLDDILGDERSSNQSNRYNGGKGNDTINLNGHSCSAYGEDGNDTFTTAGNGYHSIYGGSGDDNFVLNSGYSTVRGEDGNDTFTIKSGSSNILGGAGDDTFNFVSGSGNIVNGNEGHNVGTGSALKNNYAVNMDGANYSLEEFQANETRTVSINGIDYTVKSTASANLLYQVSDSGQIIFTASSDGAFTITGQADKAHNVQIMKRITFYGGELADTIVVGNTAHHSSVYGLGGDDIITVNGSSWVHVDGGDGNDTINSNGIKGSVIGGAGNDNITVTGMTTSVDCGSGDDTVTLGSSAKACTIYGGGSGNNTLIDNVHNDQNLINGFGSLDNATVVTLTPSETKAVNLNGVDYSIKNNISRNNFLLYSVNPVTGVVSLGGNSLIITAQKDVAHNVILSGNGINFIGGNLDDNIVMYTSNSTINGGAGNDTIIQEFGNQNTIHGDSGDDNITLNTAGTYVYGDDGNDIITLNAGNSIWSINGGKGDDTYNINAFCSALHDDGGNNIYNINVSGATVTGASGNDTFYIKGDNNIISTGGGDDYVVLDGQNNVVDGGSGDNYFVDNGTDNGFTNVNKDPNSGMLVFDYSGEVKTFEMDGITYTVTNQNADGTAPESNVLKYSYNTNTGVITLNGSDFTVVSDSAQNKINLRGDNNTINGGNGKDVITIEQGSNNIINGLGGDDTLIMNSENNSLNGGDGNDTITLNASTDKEVTGGKGNDTINVNSSNNTNIDAGAGDDKIIVKGENNIIEASSGNNNITLNGGNNEVNAGNGDNRFVITSDNNTVSAGNGNNSIGVQGSGNTVDAKNASGTVNIIGDGNNISVLGGNNDVNIKGSQNSFESETGDKNVTVNGDGNSVSTGNGNDIFEIRGNNNDVSSSNGENEVTLRGDENRYQGGENIDKITISGNKNHTNGGGANDEFVLSKGSGNVIDGEDGGRNTMINFGTNTQYTNVVDITPRPFELDVKVDLGSDSNAFVHTSISFNLFDFYVDFMSERGLAENIEKIDDMMAVIDAQLVNIGSSINRLETVLDAQNIKLENMISTRSTLRDADVAEESSALIRYQILQQASATLGASTRNINREFILGILGVVN